MRQISPSASTHFPFPATVRESFRVSRFTFTGIPSASSSTSTRCGTLRARSLSALFRVPRSDFRILLRFIVDQRVAAFRKAGPWLDLDDVMQHGALEPERDLLDGAPQGAPSAGPRGGARVPGEELQLGGARGEGGELDDQPLDGACGRRPRQ